MNHNIKTIRKSFTSLRLYCEGAAFKGYDPYDGLNSTFFQSLPLLKKSRLVRLIWIQFFKRSPFNLRKFVGIQHEYNPKAVGLFLSAYCALYQHEKNPDDAQKIKFFIEKIKETKSTGYSGACWGYNFDWESRAFFQPKNTPTIVASSFIANALLDAYEITGNKECLELSRSTCDFILTDLNRTHNNKGGMAFSYSPLDNTVVFNASLLGAKLLSRVYSITKEENLFQTAKSVIEYCCDFQKADGSWSYGTLPFHQWIDNFHTGYNLECIADYIKYTGDDIYHKNLSNGFNYYIKNFFTLDGIAKYYNNSIYPIDIHAPSQLVITLKKLNKLDEYRSLTEKVLGWTIDHMQSKNGYFYYQINKYITSKIPYMRWSQAWMFLSMNVYLQHFSNPKETD
jgi:rhamnogalacturonyl hydrolase YesR